MVGGVSAIVGFDLGKAVLWVKVFGSLWGLGGMSA